MKGVGRRGTVRQAFVLVWEEASPAVKSRLAIAVALLVVGSALAGLAPLALRALLDAVVQARASRSAWVLVLGYVGSQWLARSLSEIRSFVYARAERRLSRSLSERLFRHVMSLPLRWHLESRSGAIAQTLSNGLQGCQLVLNALVLAILPVAIEIGTMAVVLARLQQRGFLALFGGALVVYATTFTVAARASARAARAASAAQVEASAVMMDSFMNCEPVKYFSAEERVEERVRRELFRAEVGWIAFYRRYACNGIAVATVFAVFVLLTMGYATRAVSLRSMTVGTFVLLNTYALQATRPVEMLGLAMQSLSQGLAFIEKMLELLREHPEEARWSRLLAAAAPTDEAAPPGQLTFENVSLGYPPGVSVLRSVSFRVPAGATLGIVGESGAGKSSLVRVLLRAFEPSAGRVLLDGVPIDALPLASLRQSIGVVPQDNALLDDTIAYNIELGKPGSSRAEIEAAARRAHLHEFVVALPKGYDTRVGERGVRLSGGEKQRLAIARAVLKRPRIYVFDEATSSLDSETERDIAAALREVSRRSTTLIIAHRLSTLVHADEIIVLDRGMIVERGSHAALLQKGAKYAALWRAQAASDVAPAPRGVREEASA